MQPLEFAIAFFGGTGTALLVTAFLGRSLILNYLRKDLEKYKSEIKHDHELQLAEIRHQNDLLIKEQDRQDKYRAELAIRQLDAVESLWKIFESTSLTEGEKRILSEPYSNPSARRQEALNFISAFTDEFNRRAGLYISKETRQILHEFRDHIRKHILEPEPSTETIPLTSEQVEKFKQLRKAARTALRRELGSTDLRAAREDFGRPSLTMLT